MPPISKLQTKDFTEHEKVKACLQQLNQKFTTASPMVVSDVVDGEGHQYVHLVQKGGGVLGVALVGYTYVLEAMGIRFLKQAGTSAGAINTALMTVIGTKQDPKSTSILKAICELDFFSLVDGHPVARGLIKKFIRHGDFMARVKKWIGIIFGVLGFLIVADIVLLGLQHKFVFLSFFAGLSFVLTGIWTLLIAVAVIYTQTLLRRLKNAGQGVNPGDTFYDWIKERLKENGVNTVTDLNNKARADIPGLRLRMDHPKKMEGLEGEVTFIASELVTQNKIQFPAMCRLFRKQADIDTLQPAGFVRASMSIPVFFESYMINDIPCDDPEIKRAWLELMNLDDAPSTTRFVDGGILSNFPISIFYSPDINVPRLPVFGIDLDDIRPGDKGKSAPAWSLMGYAGRMFNTIRNYYDKDFLIKNKIYEKGIGKIKVLGYNWLNFFMTDEEKKALFILGAQAATQFLLNFDWEEYKCTRIEMQQVLDKK